MTGAVDAAPVSYLALCPWDIDRWQNSGAYRRMTLAGQGAYLNLCFAAWKNQPSCALPDDDRDLWRFANAGSIDEWRAVKSEAFASDAWELSPAGWVNEVVLETYAESIRRHAAAVRSGRIAGKESARVRRAQSQVLRMQQDRTAVQRQSNESPTKSVSARPTIVNPPSPSPSPSPETDLSASADAILPPTPTSIVYDYWSSRTKTFPRKKEKLDTEARIGRLFRAGFSIEDLCRVVDYALVDEFYAEKGYAKQPVVIWKNSERVASLLERAKVPTTAISGAAPRGQYLSRPEKNKAILQAQLDALRGKN